MPKTLSIAAARLHHQSIDPPRHRRPADVVSWLGVVQGQEYEPAKWGIGLRMADAVDATIEAAMTDGSILRTHILRPTWHFVTPADIRWMLELTGPRVQRSMAPYNRRMELDDRTLTRGTQVIERALRDGQFLTRLELADHLQRAGLEMRSTRLAHLVMHAEQEGVICSGPRKARKFTYALLAERAPAARRLARDEALAELALRFFRSHGPATVRDFSWWSGLTMGDARRGLEMNQARKLEAEGHTYWTIGPEPDAPPSGPPAHLLPIYDEYLVAYRDRLAVPHGPSTIGAGRESIIFQHALVISGQIAGTWRMARTPSAIELAVTPMRPLKRPERTAVSQAAGRYERFTGTPVTLRV